MHHKTWERLAVILGQLHDWSLSLNCQQELSHEKVSEKEKLFWIFCWEMPIINMGISQERKRLLNIVSQKLISYDFCTSFVLHKVKKTFGGSKWKLVELMRVSRYLAYVKGLNPVQTVVLWLIKGTIHTPGIALLKPDMLPWWQISYETKEFTPNQLWLSKSGNSIICVGENGLHQECERKKLSTTIE